jgi:hypothetical protein
LNRSPPVNLGRGQQQRQQQQQGPPAAARQRGVDSPPFYKPCDLYLTAKQLKDMARGDSALASWSGWQKVNLTQGLRDEFMALAKQHDCWAEETQQQPAASYAARTGGAAPSQPSTTPYPPPPTPPQLNPTLPDLSTLDPALSAVLTQLFESLAGGIQQLKGALQAANARVEELEGRHETAHNIAQQQLEQVRTEALRRVAAVTAHMDRATHAEERQNRLEQRWDLNLQGSGATEASSPEELQQLAVTALTPAMGAEAAQQAVQAASITKRPAPRRQHGGSSQAGGVAAADIILRAPDKATHKQLVKASSKMRGPRRGAASSSAASGSNTSGDAGSSNTARLKRVLTPKQHELLGRLISAMEQARANGARYNVDYMTMKLWVTGADGVTSTVDPASWASPGQQQGGRPAGEEEGGEGALGGPQARNGGGEGGQAVREGGLGEREGGLGERDGE